MTAELVLAKSEFLVPEDRQIKLIAACADQLALASSIPEVLKLVSQADAINAVMASIKASRRAQKAALRLRVEAEAQLGRITAQIPHGKRGGRNGCAAIRGQRTKRQVLTENGIHHYRAGVAERLAKKSPEAIDEAVENAKSSGMYGVLHDLGLRKPWREYQLPEKAKRDIAYLAEEAISLLERSVQTKSAPHAGTVTEYRARLTRIVGQR